MKLYQDLICGIFESLCPCFVLISYNSGPWFHLWVISNLVLPVSPTLMVSGCQCIFRLTYVFVLNMPSRDILQMRGYRKYFYVIFNPPSPSIPFILNFAKCFPAFLSKAYHLPPVQMDFFRIYSVFTGAGMLFPVNATDLKSLILLVDRASQPPPFTSKFQGLIVGNTEIFLKKRPILSF